MERRLRMHDIQEAITKLHLNDTRITTMQGLFILALALDNLAKAIALSKDG